MRDEVQRCVALGEAGDRRVDVFSKRRDRLLAAGIVDIQRCEAGCTERPFQPLQGCRGPRDAVKQNHSRASRIA
jgi:hypothetical protein